MIDQVHFVFLVQFLQMTMPACPLLTKSLNMEVFVFDRRQIVTIIMEICKAPALRLKALNKYSITHIMYIEMEMLSAIKIYI